MRFKLNQSLGLDDARRCNQAFGASLPLDGKKLQEGQSIDLPQAAVDWLTGAPPNGKGYVALLEPTGATVPPQSLVAHNEADESPVSSDNAADAIDHIGRMKSAEKLTEIVRTDTRATVKKAAQERLDSLSKQ